MGVKMQQIKKKADIKENDKGGQNERSHIMGFPVIMLISGNPAGIPNFKGRIKTKKSIMRKRNFEKILLAEQILFTLKSFFYVLSSNLASSSVNS